MFASLVPFAAEIALGLDPNILLVFLTWGCLTLAIIFFRMGKPEGHLAHCILHLITPEEMRPGRVRKSEYIYPIAELYEVRNTADSLCVKYLQEHENEEI